MTDQRAPADAGRAGTGRAVVVTVAVGLTTLVVALLAGGGRPRPAPDGLPDAGPVVGWLLPVSRLAADLSAAATVGLLLTAAVLLPSTTRILSSGAVRACRAAAVAAGVWSVASLTVLVATYADVAALPLSRAFAPGLLDFAASIAQGRAWLATAVLAGIAGVVAGLAERPVSAWWALVVAGLGVLPPALVGHAAASGNHGLAVSSMVVHVLAVTTWCGGLAGLVWYATVDGRHLALAASRYSAVALWAYVGVAVSGIGNALARLDSPATLWSTGYGWLLTVKIVAFLALGALGWWHRRATLPQLRTGRAGAFRRFAAVEVLVLVALIGISVALSRTPPPGPGVPRLPTPAEQLLGFPLPGPPSGWTLLTAVQPDPLVGLALLLAGALYAAGVLRLRRRGDGWPWARALGWYAGLLVVTLATLSGLATYGRVLFSVHMTQHMLLSMLAPLLLVTGAPITLALRAITPAGRDQPAGPREWLLAVLHSRVVRVLTHPVVALVLFVTAPYMVYFSDLFETAMRHHWAHTAMHVHFVLVGYLFFETLVGTDPLPHRASYPMRLVVLFLSLPFHAFFAVALMSSDSVIAADYYRQIARPWGPTLLDDQTGGSAFAWAFGEVPAMIALVILLVQWSRDDSRQARRRDRQADRDGDAELTAYNEQLQRLNRPGPR